MSITDNTTIKTTLEGDPALVEAAAARLRQFFTVTYEAKNQRLSHHPEHVRRYLRLLPPGLAHPAPEETGPLGQRLATAASQIARLQLDIQDLNQDLAAEREHVIELLARLDVLEAQAQPSGQQGAPMNQP